MSHFNKLKIALCLIIVPLITATATFAGIGVDTKGLNSQDEALMKTSSLSTGNLVDVVSLSIKVILGFFRCYLLGFNHSRWF